MRKAVIAIVLLLTLYNCCLSVSTAQTIAPRFRWTTATWTGRDSAYSAARSKIIQDVETAKDPLPILAAYRAKAQRNDKDPYSVFCWAVAGFECARKTFTDKDYSARIAGVYSALDGCPSPDNYEFIRIKYLYDMQSLESVPPEIIPVGNRLLKHNYNDVDVLQQVAIHSSTSDLPRAVHLMRYAINLAPNRPGIKEILGLIYENAYEFGAPTRNAVLALKYFRLALTQMPKARVDDISRLRRCIDTTNNALLMFSSHPT